MYLNITAYVLVWRPWALRKRVRRARYVWNRAQGHEHRTNRHRDMLLCVQLNVCMQVCLSACILILSRMCWSSGHGRVTGVSGVPDMCGIEPGITSIEPTGTELCYLIVCATECMHIFSWHCPPGSTSNLGRRAQVDNNEISSRKLPSWQTVSRRCANTRGMN